MASALATATKTFNADLVTKNNAENEGAGVFKVLSNLKDVSLEDKSTNLKKDKDIKKEQLVAGLAFLRGQKLDDVKKDLTKLKVEELRNMVVTRYEHIRPNKCEKCKDIYRYFTEEHITYRCINCSKGMCPSCCTSESMKKYDENNKCIIFSSSSAHHV